ncbi:MAG: hypothetical protein ACNYWU_00875 [Desulfobacterales bacterium]
MCSQSALPSLYLGTFNSEYFWTDPEFSTLPSFTDTQADAIVSVMDELQFVLCNNPGDLVISKYSMNPAHKAYLQELGFVFLSNEYSVIDNEGNDKDALPLNQSICQLLIESPYREYFQGLFSSVSNFSPYSVMPFSYNFCINYDIQYGLPEFNTVKKVNSKFFSHDLSKRLFENSDGQIAHSAKELLYLGKGVLKKSSFLIKAPFGVSGKGNFLITSESLLKGIAKHLERQEKKGKQTKILLEPLLDKHIDFSCHFAINHTGTMDFITIQQMENTNFSFSSIHTGSPDLLKRLEKSGYFNNVEKIARALYHQGYYGYVCLDSMMLKDETIIPIIEINARKSMGLINHCVDEFLRQFSLHGCLSCFSFELSRDFQFEEIIYRLQKEDIFFEKYKSSGVLPLSANTLLVNSHRQSSHKLNNSNATSSKPYNGRLYASIVADNIEMQKRITTQLNKVFSDF